MQKGQLSQCNAFEMMALLSHVMNCAILEETVFFCATKQNHVVLLKYNPFNFSLCWLPYHPWFSLGNKAGLSDIRPLCLCQKATTICLPEGLFFLRAGGSHQIYVCQRASSSRSWKAFYGKLERRPFYNRYGVFVFIEETFLIEILSFVSLHSESSLTTQSPLTLTILIFNSLLLWSAVHRPRNWYPST